MVFNKVKFANIIKSIKETYSSQEEFSKKAGIGRTYLSQYMNLKKDNPPKLAILKKLADASNSITTYKELMLICNYIDEELDSICGESISLIPNPYSQTLDYNPSEQFLFSIIHSYNNLDNYNQELDEKNKIVNAYNYIKNDDTYKRLIKEYQRLKEDNLRKTKKIELDDIDIAFASGIKGLNKENQEIAKNIIEGLLAKQKNEENKNEEK